jgi:hypothetical protein
MSTLGAFLLILAGLAIMAYGIFLFYAWLPVLYGLFGLEIGLLLGRSLTGEVGAFAITLGVVAAVILFIAAYLLSHIDAFCWVFPQAPRSGLQSRRCSDWIISSAALRGRSGSGGCHNRRGHRTEVLRAFIIVASVRRCAMLMAGAHALFPGVALLTGRPVG